MKKPLYTYVKYVSTISIYTRDRDEDRPFHCYGLDSIIYPKIFGTNCKNIQPPLLDLRAKYSHNFYTVTIADSLVINSRKIDYIIVQYLFHLN